MFLEIVDVGVKFSGKGSGKEKELFVLEGVRSWLLIKVFLRVDFC